jgi:hypothetical protein
MLRESAPARPFDSCSKPEAIDSRLITLFFTPVSDR